MGIGVIEKRLKSPTLSLYSHRDSQTHSSLNRHYPIELTWNYVRHSHITYYSYTDLLWFNVQEFVIAHPPPDRNGEKKDTPMYRNIPQPTNSSCDWYQLVMWLVPTRHVIGTNSSCDWYQLVMWLVPTRHVIGTNSSYDRSFIKWIIS